MSAKGKAKQQQAGGRRDKEIASNEGTVCPSPSLKPSLSSPPIAPLKPYTICTTAVEAAEACKVLQTSPYVLVDCEGYDLNSPSLVQIGTPHAVQVFLFDFLALPAGDARAGVAALLADPSVLKVFWDGRNDYSDLLSACGSLVVPVLDLQLVDIHSRSVRNVTHYAHIARLIRSRSSPPSLVTSLQLEDVHVLNGMDGAINEHGVSVALKDPAVKKMHAENRASEWLNRPLPAFLLNYAAKDIVRLAALYDHFVAKDYLTSDMLPELQTYSQDFYTSCVPLTPEEEVTGNLYKRSFLLPLDVVPPGFGYGPRAGYFAPPASTLRQQITCKMCSRTLPKNYFPFVLRQEERATIMGRGRLVKPLTPNAPRSSSCKACTVHLERERFEREGGEWKAGGRKGKGRFGKKERNGKGKEKAEGKLKEKFEGEADGKGKNGKVHLESAKGSSKGELLYIELAREAELKASRSSQS